METGTVIIDPELVKKITSGEVKVNYDPGKSIEENFRENGLDYKAFGDEYIKWYTQIMADHYLGKPQKGGDWTTVAVIGVGSLIIVAGAGLIVAGSLGAVAPVGLAMLEATQTAACTAPYFFNVLSTVGPTTVACSTAQASIMSAVASASSGAITAGTALCGVGSGAVTLGAKMAYDDKKYQRTPEQLRDETPAERSAREDIEERRRNETFKEFKETTREVLGVISQQAKANAEQVEANGRSLVAITREIQKGNENVRTAAGQAVAITAATGIAAATMGTGAALSAGLVAAAGTGAISQETATALANIPKGIKADKAAAAAATAAAAERNRREASEVAERARIQTIEDEERRRRYAKEDREVAAHGGQRGGSNALSGFTEESIKTLGLMGGLSPLITEAFAKKIVASEKSGGRRRIRNNRRSKRNPKNKSRQTRRF